jgi:hypothetical protein
MLTVEAIEQLNTKGIDFNQIKIINCDHAEYAQMDNIYGGDYVALFQGNELSPTQLSKYKYEPEQWYFWIDDYFGAINDPQLNWYKVHGEGLVKAHL